MCGRIAYYFDPDDPELPLIEKFLAFKPDYNVYPTKPVPTILNTGETGLICWGLIPPRAKNKNFHPFNARAESLTEKPLFREPYRSKRCLIVVSGFYEPHQLTGDQYYFKPNSGIFALAGLWDTWAPRGKAIMNTCTIITTTPNPMIEPIHNRMPVILKPENYNLWLDRSVQSPEELDPLLVPFDGDMTHYQVAPFVSDAKNNGPECVEPYTPDSDQLHF